MDERSRVRVGGTRRAALQIEALNSPWYRGLWSLLREANPHHEKEACVRVLRADITVLLTRCYNAIIKERMLVALCR